MQRSRNASRALEWPLGRASHSLARMVRAAGCRVAVEYMKARRLVLYVAGAAIGVGLAYFLAIAAARPARLARDAQGRRQEGRRQGPRARRARDRGDRGRWPTCRSSWSAPGTVEPLANVAVKPRVDGQIVEVLFKEGDLVNEGDVLFRLDDRMVKAQIAQAEANIAKDQASLRDAEATLARREALIDKKVVTEAALDQARYRRGGPEGQHRRRAGAARIAEDPARLSHHPRADHRPHRQPQRQGRRHGARRRRGCALVTINQTKPIWVTFAVPQSELGALRRALAAKAQGRDHASRRREADGRAGHDRLHRQPGRQADRHDHRQGDRRERRRGAVARPVGRGRAHGRGEAAACCRCRRARCCRRSRA